jgi:acid-sensing ion channel, other
MGRLYDGDIEGVEEFGNFQDILDKVDANKSTGIYNSRKKLLALTPNCSDYIVKCKWGGKFFNCEEMIELQLTIQGNFISLDR